MLVPRDVIVGRSPGSTACGPTACGPTGCLFVVAAETWRDDLSMEAAAGLHAYLSYRDAGAGLRWLERVGFNVSTRMEDADGNIFHAEVRLGDAVISVATADAAYETPRVVGDSTGAGLYLWLPQASDVDAWHAAAIGAGGQELIAPQDTEWGTRRARVLDPGGHEWSVGTYRPGGS